VDAPGNYTYDMIGTRRVQAYHTGHDKVSVCGLFASPANARRLTPIIMIKRSKPFPNLVVPEDLIVEYSAKGII